ncbi:MAG: sensor histidine kinase [Candidatus Gastranaerophilaceae bacterium]
MFKFFKNLFVKENEETDLLTKLPDSVVLINSQGNFLWYNDVAQETLSNIRENFADGYIDSLFENAMELILKVADTNKSKVIRTKDSTGKDLFFEVTARRTDEGLLVSLRDNTQSYKTLTSIVVEHESMRKVNRDKNNFLVKLSSELKTPLQSIIGFSQAILDGLGGEMNPKQEKYISIINKNSEDVLSLLNKIFELSKAESNLFEHKLEYFDAVNTLKSVIKSNEQLLNAKDIAVNLDISSEIKRSIYSDESLLRLILQDIIEVAIKSTDVGSIDIEVKHPDLELVNEKGLVPFENANEKSFLMFIIKDMGLGISDNELDVLFEPYTQLDNPNKSVVIRSIAFATIKNLIRILKGNMWVDSEPMHGSTYSIIIPTEKVMQTGNE